MYKNQRGITLVSLAVTIAVILIISTIGISAGMSIIRTARLQELATNMLLIQAKAKAEAEKYNFDNTSITLTGTAVDSDTISQLQSESIKATFKDTNLVYKLNQDNLNDMGLTNLRLKNNEYFVVDYGDLDVEVYYLPNGFEYKTRLLDETRIYYKLSEILQVNINEEI